MLELPFEDKDLQKQLEKITVGEFTFPEPNKRIKKISKHAKNLVRAILNPNPLRRPTIAQIRKAKWFKDARDSSSDDDFMENVIKREEFKAVLTGRKK